MTHAKYRHALPQLQGKQMLTDGGLETTLIFHQEIDLPYFAAFDLLRTRQGCDTISSYYEPYAEIARRTGKGFLLESPTWRCSRDWGDKLGYSEKALDQVNRDAIALLARLRDRYDSPGTPCVISGNIGPRGDGYVVSELMTEQDAQAYHQAQVNSFRDSATDMIAVLTMNYVQEAVGAARAAQEADMPVVISFTVETDGRLPSGQDLGEAIIEVDAKTGRYPAYFMINCAHPTHFESTVVADADWKWRVRGVRANASRMSHEELDNSETLDDGDPLEFGGQYRALQAHLPELVVFGGCCGTDHRHVEEIARQVAA